MREQVEQTIREQEQLQSAKDIFKTVAQYYVEQETDAARLRQLINIIDGWGKGSRALSELHKRGLDFPA